MRIQLLLAACCAAPLASPAPAAPTNDPRTPINALNTPGDADSVFRIDASGSYYLEANLLGEAGKSGIEIDAPDVRIDLMGFRLIGAASSLAAIVAEAGTEGLSIRNGAIAHWEGGGLMLGSTQGARIHGLTIRNVNVGIHTAGSAQVEACSVTDSVGHGINVGGGSLVSGCRVVGSGMEGIVAFPRSRVLDCVVLESAGAGILLGSHSSAQRCSVHLCLVGISGASGATVSECTVAQSQQGGVIVQTGTVRDCALSFNGGHGIEAGPSSRIVGNVIESSTGDGIRTEGGAHVEGNHVRYHQAGVGIRVGSGSLVTGCEVHDTLLAGIVVGSHSRVRQCVVRASGASGIALSPHSSAVGCSVSGSLVGIQGLLASTVTDCDASSNAQQGVVLASGTVRDCSVAMNGGHGIEVLADAHVLLNRVASNLGDGIRTEGGARIEENHVRDHRNGTGIRAGGTGNFVVRNSLLANAIPLSALISGNFVGPLVHVNAVNGRSEPWANIHGN